ncbi:hypothetical protein ACFE04_016827 [Oxalis oulophora]
MSILRRFPLRNLNRRRNTFSSLSAAVIRRDTTLLTPAPITSIDPAAEHLFNVTVDVSYSPHLIASYTRAGQYVQLKVPEIDHPTYLAIASPPKLAAARGVFEFLVKSVEGSIAEILCGLKKGVVVELSQAIGKGYEIDRIESPIDYSSILIFATGSGISTTSFNEPQSMSGYIFDFEFATGPGSSPIRSLIESGFSADKRSDVRLYYGARNLRRMAYQDRFKDWESSGVKVVPVLSQPDAGWTGETGYVQAAFARAKKISSPKATGVVLCGQRQMAEEVTSILLADGVSNEKILKNF